MDTPKGYPLKWFKDQQHVREMYQCVVCEEVIKKSNSEWQISRARCVPRSDALTTKLARVLVSLIQCRLFRIFILLFLEPRKSSMPFVSFRRLKKLKDVLVRARLPKPAQLY